MVRQARLQPRSLVGVLLRPHAERLWPLTRGTTNDRAPTSMLGTMTRRSIDAAVCCSPRNWGQSGHSGFRSGRLGEIAARPNGHTGRNRAGGGPDMSCQDSNSQATQACLSTLCWTEKVSYKATAVWIMAERETSVFLDFQVQISRN